MAECSASLVVQKKEPFPVPAKRQLKLALTQRGITLRRSSRIAKNLAAAKPLQQRRGSSSTPQCVNLIQTTSDSPINLFSEEAQVPAAVPRELLRFNSISDARVAHWRDKGTWPTEEQEEKMDCPQENVLNAIAKKRSLLAIPRRQLGSGPTAETRTASDQQPREQKSAPYKHPQYVKQLKGRGSFMGKYREGVTPESEELCRILLETPQIPPGETLFSDDLFESTLDMTKDRGEARVIRDIAQLIVPPAEILAIRGDTHLESLRETINAGWNNAIPVWGPRPQPDYGLGFKSEAFTAEQSQKLEPFIGDVVRDCSYFTATYDMYFPFLTCEIKCGGAQLEVADRQNLHSQTVALRGLIELFRLVGRERELHRHINGFSISHNDKCVNIWGHYAIINGNDFTFYRHPIDSFILSKTARTDNRWTAYTFVRNVYDLWLPEHFQKICSAIDQLPATLNFEVSDQSEARSLDQDPAQPRTEDGVDDHNIPAKQMIANNKSNIGQTTSKATQEIISSTAKRKRRRN